LRKNSEALHCRQISCRCFNSSSLLNRSTVTATSFDLAFRRIPSALPSSLTPFRPLDVPCGPSPPPTRSDLRIHAQITARPIPSGGRCRSRQDDHGGSPPP